MCRKCKNDKVRFWWNSHCQCKFRWFPKFIRWGNMLSIYWLGKEFLYQIKV